MDMIPSTSSLLSVYGYNPETQTFVITFKSGGSYEYTGVPQDVYDGFAAASSQGSHFLQNIKNKFAFTKQ